MAAEHVRALGERIRVRREELGMTQDEVARQMKGTVDGQRISKWERGENRPRDESLEDLARVLQTTALALLAPTTDAPTPSPFPERTVEGALAGILAQIQAQLAEQTEVLNEIRQLLTSDQQVTTETQEATQRLLGAVDVATRELRGDAPRTAEEREPRAK